MFCRDGEMFVNMMPQNENQFCVAESSFFAVFFLMSFAKAFVDGLSRDFELFLSEIYDRFSSWFCGGGAAFDMLSENACPAVDAAVDGEWFFCANFVPECESELLERKEEISGHSLQYGTAGRWGSAGMAGSRLSCYDLNGVLMSKTRS